MSLSKRERDSKERDSKERDSKERDSKERDSKIGEYIFPNLLKNIGRKNK